MKVKFLPIYQCIILLLYFNSMYPWYIWNNHIAYLSTAIAGLVSLVMLSLCNTKKEFNENIGLVLTLVILAGYMCLKGNINNMISWICQLIIWLGLVGLDEKTKIRTFRFITKWFAIFLIISVTFYLLWLLNIFSLTPTRIQFDDGRYISDNYYLFTNSVVNTRLEDFFRFKSIFMEPGHMTMGVVPLIILNRFNFRNIYVSFLFIAEILSFSLAGMISMFSGYILLNLNKKIIRSLWLGAILIICLIWGINQAGYGEVLDVYLWNRIEITEDGEMAGYNRTTENFDKLFDRVIVSPDCIFGVEHFDTDLGDGGNAGYKPYIVQNGLFGLLLVLIIYSYYFKKYKTYSVFVVTLVFLMLLFQDTCPTWISVLSAYILGIPCFIKDSNIVSHTIHSNHKSTIDNHSRNESIVCRT